MSRPIGSKNGVKADVVAEGGYGTPTPTPVESNRPDDSELLELMKGIASGMSEVREEVAVLGKKVRDIETNGVNKFKDGAKAEDIESANSTRRGIDPKVSSIVDEMLGADFGAEFKPLGDRPGFRFTLIVPTRLSDNVQDRRPIKEVDADGNLTGKYVKDAAGNVMFEDYVPEDRRSRIIASGENYDAIKSHCEKVRAYIVAEFQKKNQPLPEFKVK